ncbi:Mu transposase C-terminal domain-containing protein [Roseateles sp. DXS20W]|uniref:Mu transposase C-terminal domain-containing protein n=1 Tax=Pelomonas lactea TaxID=3299030 RepID=A0ABW7GJY8_9BURK
MSARATASELAGLPGMPADKSGVIRRAAAAGWTYDEEPGRGGMRRLYHVDQLPSATRAALAWNQPKVLVVGAVPDAAAKQEQLQASQAGQVEGARLALRGGLEKAAASARQQTALRQANALAPAAQARMDARLAVVRAFEAFAKACGLPLHQARTAFALQYNDGTIDVPATVRTEVPSTSDSSIERWQAQLKKSGIMALAGAYGNRAGSGCIDSQPALAEFVKAMLVQYPHARAAHVMQGLRARFTGPHAVMVQGLELPSLRTLERWIGAWREANAEVLKALSNPDAWKNEYMVAFGSASEGITELNQLWELDSTPGDLLLADGKRYVVIGGIDVGTRWMRLVVAPTSRATAVAALIRRMLLDMGVPRRVKTDNGSDYASHHIARVFAALSEPGEKMQDFCPPFQPWHKPHIERGLGTFSHDLVELCSGYIGHDVAERSAIEARKSFADRLMTRGETVELRMTPAELQAFCDRWTDDVYMHNPHSGLGGKTPFEAAARGCADRRVIDDEHTLDILLAEAPGSNGRRTVGKKGIRLDDAHFIAPELEAWVGREVFVRFDPIHHDLGTIYVFGGDDMQFICKAVAPERTGMDRREVAIKAKAMQTARVQAERKALKAAAKKVGTDQIVDEILRQRAADAGKLASLVPRRAAAHESAGVSAAAAAAQAATAPRRTTADLADLAAVQQTRDRIAAEAVPTGTANDLAAQRTARAGGVTTPIFDNLAQRVDWLLRQARVRQLGTEEADCLAQFKRAQPASYRRIADLVDEQLGSQQEKAPDRVAGGSGAV